MSEIEIRLGSNSDFLKFLHTAQPHDKATLRSYFRIACKKKQLLLIRRTGPQYSQVFIIPLESLPTIKEKINMKHAIGFIGMAVPVKTYLIFGEAIQEQEEVGQFHKEEAAALIETPSVKPKTKGRPKKDE